MSFQLALLNKVRCRFLCSDSGAPVSGIVATLTLGFGESTQTTRTPFGSLCSDAAGYMSFDLKPLIARGVTTAEKLLLVGPTLPNGEVNLLDTFLSNGGVNVGEVGTVAEVNFVGSSIGDDPDAAFCIVFPVFVSDAKDGGKKAATSCSDVSLPSIQSPDVCDYEVSPFSFVMQSAVSLGDDCCESLVPASLPVQEHKFYKVVVRREENEADLDLFTDLSDIVEVNVTDQLASRAPKLKFAEVLEFKQQWYSLGHSLGEIKYSLALAPGEATQVAIIDWSRQDSTARTDNVLANERMDHSLKRDRSIEETIESALKESQGGSSFMAGTSGQATIPLQSVTLSFNHAIGYGVTNSWGNRNLEAESLQDLHDKIRQQSGYTRSLNSTVVVQATQAEQNVLQTRKVANHNHCHALTIQYYEVLRHFKIRTAYSGRRKAILVPFQLFFFTWELALQFRSILESVLIDPSLKRCFDAMFRSKVAPSIYEEAPDQGSSITALVTAPVTKLLTKSFDVFTYLAGGNGSNVYVKSEDHIRISATGEALTGGLALFGPDGHEHVATSDFTAPGFKKFSLIFKIGMGGPWNQGGSIVSDFAADRDGELIFSMNDVRGDYDNNRPTDHSPQKDRWAVEVTYPVTEPAEPVTPGTPDPTPEAESGTFSQAADELCSTKLLAHLNGNQGYYNGCVWILQNPIERRLRLEAALATHPDLLDAIDDVPLAVSGNCVAFAYDGPFTNWQATRDLDPSGPIEDIVTLPTRGVFAEAQLGHCNACEERDPTRMWDWNEMTIETPPEIGGVTPGPRGQAPSITPTQLPGNVIQITQPQPAPDPLGLAAALKVLGTPDIFRDMSGLDEVSSLLETLSKQSSEANIKALAQQAQKKLTEAKTETAAGHGDSSSDHGKTRTPASESDPAKQVDRLKAIEYAKEKGLIDENQGNDAAQGVLGGEETGGGTTTLEDALSTTINLAKYCTPEARAFSPNSKTGQTTLRAVVTGAPAGSTWRWSVATPTAARIVSPNAYVTDVVGGDPGLTDITFEARDPGGASLGTRTVKLSVPQFVIIDEEAAAFNAQLVVYHLNDVKPLLLQKARQVVDLLLDTVNVRTIWRLAPFAETLPAHLAPGGFAAGKFSPLTIRDVHPVNPSIAGVTGDGGPTVFDDPINIYPAAFRINGMDVGADVSTIVNQITAAALTDPITKILWIEIMGRLLGETMAHEIVHALLGGWPGMVEGHNSPSIPFDLMNRGTERHFTQRTAFEMINVANFPAPNSYRDGGIAAISGLQPSNQAKIDAVFPVPPALT